MPQANEQATTTEQTTTPTDGDAGAKGASEDHVAAYESQHNLEAKAAERKSLEDDVERFLRSGGEITEVPKDFRADPPKRPESNYGRGSI